MSTVRRLSRLVCAVVLVAMARGHGAGTASCGHDHHAQTIYQAPPLRELHVRPTTPSDGDAYDAVIRDTIAEHRRMHAQQGGTWRPLRIRFNYTYVDNPERDVRPGTTDGYMACFSGDNAPTEVWAGSPTAQRHFCFDDDGTHRFIENCLMRCTSDSIVTAADVAELKRVTTLVGAKFNAALMAEQLPGTDDKIAVSSEGAALCGQMEFPYYELEAIDIVMYATIRPLLQTGSTIAFARTCATHSTSARPTLAHMNVAPETLKLNNNLYDVLQHELTHALGFTPSMYGMYRHPDNNTQTYREYDEARYPNGPLQGTGAFFDAASSPPRVSVDYTQLSANPGSTLKFITPTLVEQARLHWNCSTLDGVELENGGNSSSSTASHWEMRVLKGEYMVARQSEDMRFTVFTLSLFHDMGFYRANLGEATVLDWGRHLGCPWATGKCNEAWSPEYFCDYDAAGCGFDFEFTGRCQYTTALTADIPAVYQYFPNAANPARTGGSDELADYCPYVGKFANQRPCQTAVSKFSSATTPGTSSQCFPSTMTEILSYLEVPSPECYKLFCNSSSPADAPWATVQIGRGLYPCAPTGDAAVRLVYYPRRVGLGTAVIDSSHYVGFSTTYNGTVQCGPMIVDRCRNPGANGLNTTAELNIPSITAVAPAEGVVEGGTEFNITGTNLDQCEDILVGGVAAVEITRQGSTIMKGKLGVVAADGIFGGSGLDGIGVVDVELWCNVSAVCPEGCSVGRLKASFTLKHEETDAVNLSGALEDFVGTTVGKVVAVVLGIIVLIIIVCILKSCLAEGDSGEASLKDPMQRQRPVEMTNKRRDDFDDDDLL